MLCWPARDPRSGSRRLPGGIASFRKSRTRLSCVSLRRSTGQSADGHAARAGSTGSSASQAPAAGLAVDVAPVADPDDCHRHNLGLDLVDHTVVSTAETVEIIGPSELFRPLGPRIRGESFNTPTESKLLAGRQCIEFPLRAAREKNAVRHLIPLRRRRAGRAEQGGSERETFLDLLPRNPLIRLSQRLASRLHIVPILESFE